MKRGESVHGLLAEFASPGGLVQAVRAARAAGYRRLEAYAPMVVDGLAEALGRSTTDCPGSRSRAASSAGSAHSSCSG